MLKPSQYLSIITTQVLRLTRPHIELVTVTRTGTRQPTSCGKKPNAVGQSVMLLPEKPTQDAVRLTHKGSDLLCWWQSRCSSLSAGKPRTWRRAVVQGAARIWPMGGITLNTPSSQPMQYVNVSKDSLGGKAGCDESRPSGLGRGSTKPTIRKDSKARCFYLHYVSSSRQHRPTER